ncbi:MAG: hypothetical protein AAGA48_22505 [Myxococcota bacterium]
MMRAFLAFAVVGCAAPDPTELFNGLSAEVLPATEAEALFVEAVESATSSLHIALPDAEDEALLQAIGAAFDNGLEVELTLDIDEQDDPGVAQLFDLGVPITLASDGLEYFEFALNEVVSWSSEETVMSHAYVVVDRQRIVTATTAGHTRSGDRVVFSMHGEELLEDWLIEHNQVFGGVDATAVTAFSSPAKSIADFRWRYGTATATDLEVWFGPQERITKRVIDAVYSARSSVWVMSDDLANEGLIAALRTKNRWDFDVRVLTGPGLGSTSTAVLREFDAQLINVDRREWLDVDQIPTVVIIDPDVENNGFGTASMVLVLSHELYSAARLFRGNEIVTDQLIDGALVVLSNRSQEDRAEIEQFVTFFESRFEQGVPR